MREKLIAEMKKEEGRHFVASACAQIKELGTGDELYERVYGRPGNKSEVQTFLNRLNPNRGNPSLNFIGLLIEKLPELREMTLGEFFGVDDDWEN